MNLLRKKRESLGLTLSEVAKKIKIHETTLSSWELGKKKPKPKNKLKLINFYNCTSEELFNGENDIQLLFEDIEDNHESDLPPSPFAKYTGELEIGGTTIDCYVLDSGERVISHKATVKAIAHTSTGHLAEYLKVKPLNPYINNELVSAEIITFLIPGINKLGKGITVSCFIDICNAYIAAFRDGELNTERQKEIAINCSILLSACAKTGLVALVDEATGYQYERSENSLQLKLKAFIADEMRGWEKTFPDELWEQFGRLTNWQGKLHSRPKWWGKLVMELIYDALDTDVAKYLREHKPPPIHRRNYHQWLSEHYGLKQLITHIYEIIGIAKTCNTIKDLQQKVGYHYRGKPIQMEIPLK